MEPVRDRVVVVGGAGLVGRALCRRLVDEGHDAVALDVRDPTLPGVGFAPADVLETELEPLFDRADAVVHLAARVDPPHPRRRGEMRRLHEEGTRRVVRAAVHAGVRKLVLASSAVVYGARAENPVPLTEEHAVRPLPWFPYAVDKALQEEIVLDAARQLEVAIARPAIVYGPEARSYLTEILRRAPWIVPAIDGRRPPLQFVHVDDVARALAALAHSSRTGAFNVGCREVAAFEAVAARVGLRVVDVPRALVAPLLDAAQWVVPDRLRAPSYVLDHLMFPFVLSSRRLADELGVVSLHSSLDAVDAMLRGARE